MIQCLYKFICAAARFACVAASMLHVPPLPARPRRTRKRRVKKPAVTLRREEGRALRIF